MILLYKNKSIKSTKHDNKKVYLYNHEFLSRMQLFLNLSLTCCFKFVVMTHKKVGVLDYNFIVDVSYARTLNIHLVNMQLIISQG